MNAQRAAISKRENGETTPNIYQLIAICHALSIEESFDYVEVPKNTVPDKADFGVLENTA